MHDGGGRNLALGQPWTRKISSEEYAPRINLLTPEGGAVPLALRESEDRLSFDLVVPGRWRPGVYELRFEQDTGETRSDAFAVNARASEGALVFLDPEEVASIYPTVKHLDDDAAGGDEKSSGIARGDLWYPAFSMVLVLLILELALAKFFSRARRRGV
jgi:hypothetical protein